MRYNLKYFYAVCRAFLQKDLKIFFIVKNEKNMRPTVYFKNGSYIKTVMQKDEVIRGRRAEIIGHVDGCTLNQEEIDEILKRVYKK